MENFNQINNGWKYCTTLPCTLLVNFNFHITGLYSCCQSDRKPVKQLMGESSRKFTYTFTARQTDSSRESPLITRSNQLTSSQSLQSVYILESFFISFEFLTTVKNCKTLQGCRLREHSVFKLCTDFRFLKLLEVGT